MPTEDDEAPGKNPKARNVVASGFGDRLKRLRIERGYDSQPKLARAVGIGVIAVNRHETEKATPSAEVLDAYARVLGTSVAYLQHGVGDDQLPKSVEEFLSGYESLRFHQETRRRLRLFPWSLITDNDPSPLQLRGIAEMIEAGLSTLDDQAATRVLSDNERLSPIPATGGKAPPDRDAKPVPRKGH